MTASHDPSHAGDGPPLEPLSPDDERSAPELVGRAATFADAQGLPLDDFQREGLTALERGRSVLVAAPTGAGKTLVGEFAVWRALATGGKCFYTTPIKALSNQKFADLRAVHGDQAVGLLTGDNAINGDAPIVVMTTEVLRNMLYEESATLRGLQAVVLDEVHYLADRERGAVWEEVIIQLPPEVQLACLSATVSNAEEFGAWLRQARPRAADVAVAVEAADDAVAARATECEVVISEHRPVPLEHHYAVGERFYDLFRAGGAGGRKPSKSQKEAARRAQGGVPNPEVLMLERRAASQRVTRRGRRAPAGPRMRPPRRFEIIDQLQRRDWLPAIVFVFSRDGCDKAVQQVLGDGVDLTSASERDAIRAELDHLREEIPREDRAVLGFDAFARGLEAGVAAHHAGLVPAFKEIVERLFVRGLVKVCYATETLALGINMPARTVVIERLEKWTGQQHELLTPGQFTQLTGRAGRRGLDRLGHAVVLHQRDVDFKTVAGLVGRRTQPLTSSFAPSYNMAVNLLRRLDRDHAERLLERSFAQYQAAARTGDDAEQIERNREALAGYARNLRSDHGDFAEYWALRRQLDDLEQAGAADRKRRRREAVTGRLERLREGDVVALPRRGGSTELAAVIGRSSSRSGVPLARVVTADRRQDRVGPRELDQPPVHLGRVTLPKKGGPRQSSWRARVAASMHELGLDPEVRSEPIRTDPEIARRTDELREAVRSHPVHHDPRREEIEVWARRYDELSAQTANLEDRVRHRTGSLVRQLGRIIDVLADFDYLSDEGEDPRPTERGERLAALYVETDLVLAESIRAGLLDDLDAADLAAVASVFVHETRSKDPPPIAWPTDRVHGRVEGVWDRWETVAQAEDAAGLPRTRVPDAGFCHVVHRWAGGADLDAALTGTDLTAGDFVRSVKQVEDLLRQLAEAEAGTPLARSARNAARQLVRGVVAQHRL